MIRNMDRAELTDWRPNLVQMIEVHFMPKRRKALLSFIDDEISGRPMTVRERPIPRKPTARTIRNARIATTTIGDKFQRELRELSDKYIFQWTTRYQDCLFKFLDIYFERQKEPSASNEHSSLGRHLEEHSRDIFAKGYNHTIEKTGLAHANAIQKSVSGLFRFLELPLSYYSARASRSNDQRTLLVLRQVYSESVLAVCAAESGSGYLWR